MNRALLAIPLAALAIAGCADDRTPVKTVPRDAGPIHDSGPIVIADGGDTSTDSGAIDAGDEPDGGEVTDGFVRDTGPRDAGETVDGGGFDDGGFPLDAGSARDGGTNGFDATIPPNDGGFPGFDGSIPWPDGGIPNFDGSIPWPDGGIPWPDGGIPTFDGSIPWPDGGIPNFDGSIPWPDGGAVIDAGTPGQTVVSLDPASFFVVMNLFPPVGPDPLLTGYSLVHQNPAVTPEVIGITSSTIVFFDGQVHTFDVMPVSYNAPPGTTSSTHIKAMGSTIQTPGNYCNTVVALTVVLSNGQTVTGSASAFCIQ